MNTVRILQFLGLAFVFMTGTGCAPHGESIDVAVPKAERQNKPVYSYDHKVRPGNRHDSPLGKMRKKYVVAVAREMDNKPVDTPFGQEPDVSIKVDTTFGKADASVNSRPERKMTSPARDQITSLLMQSEYFTVVERENINDIVRELDFSDSKYVSKENAQPIGNLHGVSYIISGRQHFNGSTLSNTPVTPDNWVGRAGFPESDYSEMPIVYRLRMYSVSTGEIVAIGDGYGRSREQAVQNAVVALTDAVWDYEKNTQ